MDTCARSYQFRIYVSFSSRVAIFNDQAQVLGNVLLGLQHLGDVKFGQLGNVNFVAHVQSPVERRFDKSMALARFPWPVGRFNPRLHDNAHSLSSTRHVPTRTAMPR